MGAEREQMTFGFHPSLEWTAGRRRHHRCPGRAGLREPRAGSVPAAQALANVIKVTIFLRDMSNFPKIVELRGRYFTPPYPADTIVEVTSLYSPEALIEIEAIAVADETVERR